MIEGILIGLTTALTFQNIFMVMIGCFFGTIIGMLPGLGPMTAIALMIPITYGFDPATGLILMAGVYYGAVFGGSTSSILLNAPGVPGTVATSFDGYPMAQQGKAGKALAIAAWSSFAGGTLAAIYLLFLAPSLSKVSLSFRSPDYFALMILGLTAIAAFSSKGQFIKAMMMVVLGLMLASVGQDSLSDITRFTFNNMNLTDGISFVLVVMATFAMSEALTIILKRNDPTAAAKQVSLTELGSIRINKEERAKMLKTIPRTSIIGFIIGAFWLTLLSQIGLLSFIDTFGAFFGPIFGVMISDFYFIKKRTLNNKDIYLMEKNSAYYYSGGWHIKGVYSIILGFIFAASTIWNGFSNYNQSIGYFNSIPIEIASMIFIILGSLPFIVYIKFINGNKKIFLTDIQIKTFFKVIISAIILLTLYLLLNNYENFNLRSVFFNSISILTGTGYVNSEYDSWGSFPITLFLALMFIGGCAGSTTCGIKIFRIQILYSFITNQLKKIIYPKGVFVIKYDQNSVDDKFIASIISFIYFYFVIFFILTALLSLTGLDFITAISGAATSISNVGPGLGPIIGTNGDFSY